MKKPTIDDYGFDKRMWLLSWFVVFVLFCVCGCFDVYDDGISDASFDIDSSIEDGGSDGDTETDIHCCDSGSDTGGDDIDSNSSDSNTETEIGTETETETPSGDTADDTETETNTETESYSDSVADSDDTDTEIIVDSGLDICDSPAADLRTIVCDEAVCPEYFGTYIYPPTDDDSSWPWDWCHAGEPVVIGGEVVELVPSLGLGQELSVWFPTSSYAPDDWSFRVPDYSCVRITYPLGWEVADPVSNEYLTITSSGQCCLISLFNYSTSQHGRPYRVYVTEIIGETAQDGWVFIEIKDDFDCDWSC